MDIRTLSEVFNAFYVIPSYQRGYAWEKKQLEDFWSDLENANSKKKHFFGIFFLEKKGENLFEVIDGQQRLTTLAVFLSVYAKFFDKAIFVKYIYDKSKKIYHLDYKDDNENRDYLINKIFGSGTERIKNYYQKNLKYAKDFFEKKLRTHSNPELLLTILSENFIFDIELIDKIGLGINSQIVFETLNNRGKPLTVLEKLKNRLMYLAAELDSEATIKKINNIWSQLYNKLGSIKFLSDNNTNIEDDMLSSHLTIYRPSYNTTFSVTGAETKLFQMFCNTPEIFPFDEQNDLTIWNDKSEKEKDSAGREDPISIEKILKYISSLDEFCKAWCDILKEPSLRNILMLDSTKETKILLATIYMNQNTLMLSSQKKNSLYKLIEAVIFRRELPGEWDRTYNFATLAYYFYSDKDDITNENGMSFEELKDGLQNVIDEQLDLENIISAFRELYKYKRGKIGFYKWRSIQYFLYRYEISLAKTSKLKYEESSIEHIMPQSLDGNWQTIMKHFSEENKNIILNTPGNLMLISSSKNSSLSNRSWKAKKKIYKEKAPISNGEKEIYNKPKWTPYEIKQRGEKMLNFFEVLLKEYNLVENSFNFTADQRIKLLCGDGRKIYIFDKD